MTERVITPSYFIEPPLDPNAIYEPFFVSQPIPFPENPDVSKARMVEDLRACWEMADEDFVDMYTNPESDTGNDLRSFFDAVTRGGAFTLQELGQVVGSTSPDMLRKVRSALNLGYTNFKAHETRWTMTQTEITQFMVGVIAKRGIKSYLEALESSSATS